MRNRLGSWKAQTGFRSTDLRFMSLCRYQHIYWQCPKARRPLECSTRPSILWYPYQPLRLNFFSNKFSVFRTVFLGTFLWAPFQALHGPWLRSHYIHSEPPAQPRPIMWLAATPTESLPCTEIVQWKEETLLIKECNFRGSVFSTECFMSHSSETIQWLELTVLVQHEFSALYSRIIKFKNDTTGSCCPWWLNYMSEKQKTVSEKPLTFSFRTACSYFTF
jgi:hypothetical protein